MPFNRWNDRTGQVPPSPPPSLRRARGIPSVRPSSVARPSPPPLCPSPLEGLAHFYVITERPSTSRRPRFSYRSCAVWWWRWLWCLRRNWRLKAVVVAVRSWSTWPSPQPHLGYLIEHRNIDRPIPGQSGARFSSLARSAYSTVATYLINVTAAICRPSGRPSGRFHPHRKHRRNVPLLAFSLPTSSAIFCHAVCCHPIDSSLCPCPWWCSALVVVLL